MKTFRALLTLSFLAFVLVISSCETITDTGDGTEDNRDEYIGVWRFSESPAKSVNSQSYIVTIRKDPSNSSQVILENLCNPGISDASAVGVVTTNQIVVTEQMLSNDWTIQGSGKKTGTGLMTWTYSIVAGGDQENYKATATRQ
jgi:hypothetical protein